MCLRVRFALAIFVACWCVYNWWCSMVRQTMSITNCSFTIQDNLNHNCKNDYQDFHSILKFSTQSRLIERFECILSSYHLWCMVIEDNLHSFWLGDLLSFCWDTTFCLLCITKFTFNDWITKDPCPSPFAKKHPSECFSHPNKNLQNLQQLFKTKFH